MPHILVVEDDQDLLFLYRTMLERLGYTVTTTDQTAEALMLLTNKDFDLVILDMNMPDIPGIRIIEFARDDIRLRTLPIIVISADPQWRGQCFALGIQHFLVKPVSTPRLFALLDQILSGE